MEFDNTSKFLAFVCLILLLLTCYAGYGFYDTSLKLQEVKNTPTVPVVLTPTLFTSTAKQGQIALSWQGAASNDLVVLKWDSFSSPATPADGVLLYQGSASSYLHDNLTYNQTRYYSLWATRAMDGIPLYSQRLTTTATTPEWRGLNGETMYETVWYDGNTIVGADNMALQLTNNPNAVNVTWAILKSFLQMDHTEDITYNDASFICGDFAEMLHNHAEVAGIRAAFVYIGWKSEVMPIDNETLCWYAHAFGEGHACNAFMTTDKGLVYIDDTGTESGSGKDTSVIISVTAIYKPVSIFSSIEWCPMGTVSDFGIQW